MLKILGLELDWVTIFEIIGTIAFAASGADVAIKKKMDLFGITVLGVTTAVGGGIIRDIILNKDELTAFTSPIYISLAIVASIITFLLKNKRIIDVDSKFFNFVDALGLGVFTIVGSQQAIEIKQITEINARNIILIMFTGAITGVGGGIIRDIFANRVPVIFEKNIYALASVLGTIVLMLLYRVDIKFAMLIASFTVIMVRILSIKFNVSLPKPK
ncbi:Predicted membrane protein [Mycoplasmopsis bovigenitalium]|uniref:Predicted membrane protein n=1 Tax=Mycoplasmopsis bovigenitalium TaxID=2112 RepID=A0A449A9E3_9BACT|nr:trimeric intracellular cation channel family protein [Mycoplasmopsis bovigenitalium]VEU60841.1 Predicted membrane protein [Mycoplasmopsis bovigenitalium]